FHILLPRTEGVVEHRTPVAADGSEGGTETILLVEDEDSVRGLTSRVLQSYGYKVLEAADGAEALRLAQDNRQSIHLLLSDVVMPELSGLELAHRLTRHRPRMRVLFMSGYTDDALDRCGVLHPNAAFLPKPFTAETLAHKVRETLDHKTKPIAKPAAEMSRR